MATTVSGLTVAQLDAIIAACNTALLNNVGTVSYTFNGRSHTKRSTKEIIETLTWAVAEKNRLDRGGIRVRRGIVKI